VTQLNDGDDAAIASPGRGAEGRPAVGNVGGAQRETDFITKLKDGGGLIVAAFIGVIQFVGISSGEIPNLLRNDEAGVTLAAALILLALIMAVASALTPSSSEFWRWWLTPLYIFVLSMAFIPAIVIPLPGQGGLSKWLGVGAVIVLVFSAGLTTCLLIWVRVPLHRVRKGKWEPAVDPSKTKRINYKTPLLVAAIALTVIAAYSGLRAETRSQDSSPAPRLTSALSSTSGGYSLSVTISDSRLHGSDTVELTVYGSPIRKAASHPASVPIIVGPFCPARQCGTSRCNDLACTVVLNSFYDPDSSGDVHATVELPLSGRTYTAVDIIGRVLSKSNGCRTGSERFCFTGATLVLP
jgi:hypothetical protein